MMDVIVPLFVSLGFGMIATSIVASVMGRSKAVEESVVALRETRDRQYQKAAALPVIAPGLSTLGVSVHDIGRSPLTEERDKYQLLLDEWEPAEGTPLHWSLNWLVEDVNKRLTKPLSLSNS